MVAVVSCGREAAHVDAHGDRGQDARGADGLGRQVGEVGGKERDRHLHGRVVQSPPDSRDGGADRDADRDAAKGADDELAARLHQAEAPGDHGGHGEPVGDQRRSVVDQGLALDDRHDPPRHAKPASDRGCRDRIGRRDDRSQHERLGPAEPQQAVGRGRDRDHGRQHQPNGQQPDRPDVATQLAQGREEGRRVEQRGQHGSTTSGSSSTSGIPGTRPSPSPPITSMIG